MGREKSVTENVEPNDMADALLIEEFGQYLSTISKSFAEPFRDTLKQQNDELISVTTREIEKARRTFEDLSARVEKYAKEAHVLAEATNEIKTLQLRYTAVEERAKRLTWVVCLVGIVQLVGLAALGWLSIGR